MKKIITLLVIGFLVAGVAQAAVLAKYEFTGGSTNDSAGNPLVSASAFNATLQDALTGADMATTPTATLVSDLIQVAGLDATASNSAGFVAGDYAANGHLDFSFTVQNLGAGQTIDLTSLTADWTGNFPIGSGVSIGVTETNFSAYDPETDFAYQNTSAGGSAFDVDLDVNLSSYTGLTNGDAISFRFYFKEQNNRNEAARNQQLDNIVVNGTVSGITLNPAEASLSLRHPSTTTTNAAIDVSILAGSYANDITIISVEADSGFGAAISGNTLNDSNTNETITVSYTNSGGLVDHLDTANSTLVVTWTEQGSGVTNINVAALSVGYVKTVPVTYRMQIGICPDPSSPSTPVDDPGNDWNDMTWPSYTYDTIHNLDGDVLDGVSVQFTGGGINNAGANNWPGLSTNGGDAPSEFVDSVTTDLWWNMGGLTISGLNASLKYDIYVVSQNGSTGTEVENCTVTGSEVIVSPDQTRAENTAGAFYTFLNVSPDVTGTFVIQTYNPSNNHLFNGALINVRDPVATSIMLQ